MGRRPRGDGSVFYDASRGCWVGSLDVGRDPETRRRRRRKVSAPTKTECREKLAELREEYRKAGTVGRRDIAVRQVVSDWLARPPEAVRSERSLEVYRGAGARICDGGRGVAGIGTDWQLRETRHTFVSALSEAGVDIEKIADAAGHTNSTITRRVYRHSLADTIVETATVMDRVYPAAQEPGGAP